MLGPLLNDALLEYFSDRNGTASHDLSASLVSDEAIILCRCLSDSIEHQSVSFSQYCFDESFDKHLDVLLIL